MWRAVNPDGTLTYTFVESVKASYPFYVIRVAGGLLYLGGMLVMLWNTWKTHDQQEIVGFHLLVVVLTLLVARAATTATRR